MIRHVVCFNLKPELTPDDRKWFFEQLQALGKIPTVKRLAIGKLLEPREDWYRPRLSRDYSWALMMEFDDEDALYAYQQDGHHIAVAQEIRKRMSSVKVMDFVTSPQEI